MSDYLAEDGSVLRDFLVRVEVAYNDKAATAVLDEQEADQFNRRPFGHAPGAWAWCVEQEGGVSRP
ncbi:hypothetical protein [Pseudomonas aeruginosa]|uniref:hypothetical protein n=1 Tax=Pseudomonas aeruginosa TaxID=287 RepID=UPI001FB5AD29|nr:hypothetical protein [Pseudomonas aeruginosa]MCU9458057.1 hypothetical protein [Pseudomonas aeruginosa]